MIKSIVKIAIGIGLLIFGGIQLASLQGCDQLAPKPPPNPNRGLAAVLWAVSINPAKVTPDDIDPPGPISDDCENCNGTGIVGDGRTKLTCDECDGTGKVTGAVAETAEISDSELFDTSTAALNAGVIDWTPEREWRAESDRLSKPVWFFCTRLTGCPPCKQIETFIDDPEIVESSRRFVCVKISDPKRLARWRVPGTPVAAFSADGRNIVHFGKYRFLTLPTKPAAFLATLDRGWQAAEPRLH